MSRRGYANLAEDMDFGPANMWKKAQTKIDEGYINEDAQQVANEIDEILDKAPNEESPNDALTQALGTPKYGGQPRKSKKVDTTQKIIDENKVLRKHIRELEQKVQSIPTSEHGSCSKSKVQEKEKVLENVVKEKKGIAASVPPVSLTSKKKVVEEEEMKEEEVIATRSMTKNKVKASRPMTKEVEVTSEPSNLPIQLKYILRYAERVMVDGSSFSFQLPLELFGIPRNSYILQEDVIDFCNMQKVKTLSMVAYIMYLYSFIIDLKKVLKYVFVDQSLISAGHSTREIRARNLCSRLMTSKQDQLVIAPYNPGDHWSLVIINPYDNVVYHLNSLRTSSRDDIKYIDTRNSYSQLELDEVRVEWLNFYSVSSIRILDGFLVSSNRTILDNRLLDAFKNAKSPIFTGTLHLFNHSAVMHFIQKMGTKRENVNTHKEANPPIERNIEDVLEYMIGDINEFETRNKEYDCSNPIIVTNVKEAEVDNDDSDLDQPPIELFSVHDVPSTR
uniref:Ubiquitin-like protease family profile domain-containing protein n=1 Tax=Cucumis melo TaxID=3656 RepID=A0A9I9E6I9_CUCME